MKKNGFTLIEALVVVGILAILAAILAPIFSRGHSSREIRNRVYCQSNLKQICLAVKQYLPDYDEKYPLAKNSNHGLSKADNWAGQLEPYLKSEQLFQCPSDNKASDAKKSSYAYNARLSQANDRKILYHESVILSFEVVADANNRTQTGSFPNRVSARERHLGSANYAFVDGHVKWIRFRKISNAKLNASNYTFNIR